MSKFQTISALLSATLIGGAAIATALPSHARSGTPSACAGLSQEACGAKAECKWTEAKSYTRKSDGKEMTRKAHCRLGTRKPAKPQS